MKITYFTALLLLGMLTAACSGDKNSDSPGAAERNKTKASMTEPAEGKPGASETKQAESMPGASEAKAAENKPAASAPKSAETEAEATASKEAAGESDAFFLNKKPVSNSVKNAGMYNSVAKKEKYTKTEIISDLIELAELAAKKKVSEELIEQYKQCVKNYADSIDDNSPDKYRQHVRAIDSLLEAALNLGPIDPDSLSDRIAVYALCFLKFSYMYSAEDVTDEEFSVLEAKLSQLDEEIKRKQTDTEQREPREAE